MKICHERRFIDFPIFLYQHYKLFPQQSELFVQHLQLPPAFRKRRIRWFFKAVAFGVKIMFMAFKSGWCKVSGDIFRSCLCASSVAFWMKIFCLLFKSFWDLKRCRIFHQGHLSCWVDVKCFLNCFVHVFVLLGLLLELRFNIVLSSSQCLWLVFVGFPKVIFSLVDVAL